MENFLAKKNCDVFPRSSGIYTGSQSEFRDYAYELWFGPYERGATDSSSGFEHVFMGEIDGGGEVGGFHNWIHYRLGGGEGKRQRPGQRRAKTKPVIPTKTCQIYDYSA